MLTLVKVIATEAVLLTLAEKVDRKPYIKDSYETGSKRIWGKMEEIKKKSRRELGREEGGKWEGREGGE